MLYSVWFDSVNNRASNLLATLDTFWNTIACFMVFLNHYSISGALQKHWRVSGTHYNVSGILQKHLLFQADYTVLGTLQNHSKGFQEHFIVSQEYFRNTYSFKWITVSHVHFRITLTSRVPGSFRNTFCVSAILQRHLVFSEHYSFSVSGTLQKH